MKKKIQIAYLTVFLVVCLVPLVCIPFVNTDETTENRQLSEMPELMVDGKPNLQWPSEFETYFSEHFAFRQDLVTLDSTLKSDVFNVSSNEKVIAGKNGWLYFASTLNDYLRLNTMSEREINNTAKTLSLMQEYVEANDKTFLFFVAPNKNTVYPNNMPERYVKSSSPSNLEMLTDALDNYSVNQAVIAPLFTESDKVMYHSRDSHWTNEGALMVYNHIMDTLGIEHDSFADVPHNQQQIWKGDLDSMLFPTLDNLSEQEVYDIAYSFDYMGSFMGEDDILIKTVNEDKSAKILLYRDSFGRSLYPFIAENCFKAAFSRELPYRLSIMNDIKADYVVVEIVERNIENITCSAPVMPAPTRQLELSAAVQRSDVNTCDTMEKSGMLKVYGKLDEQYFNDTSEIFVTLENNDGIYAFEAFPVFEAELLGESEKYAYGYSLFIDTESVANGSYDICVYVKNGDAYICTDTLKSIDL